MIATRFRAVAWAAGVAAAALSCYLVSLQVASERANLMKTERRILAARADIRQLRTELDTRSRMVQLERWNRDVLGLQAPQVTQYAAGAVELAGYVAPRPTPQIIPVSAPAPQLAAPVVTQVALKPAPVEQPAMIRPATFVRPPAPQPLLQKASLAAPAPSPSVRFEQASSAAEKPCREDAIGGTPFSTRRLDKLDGCSKRTGTVKAKPASNTALLGDDLLGELGRAAAAEARTRGR